MSESPDAAPPTACPHCEFDPERREPCPVCGFEGGDPPLPWGVDAEQAGDLLPDTDATDTTKAVRHPYRDIYFSTPYHKRWAVLPERVQARVWPPNAPLVVERLALFFQALAGATGLLRPAATRVLDTLDWPPHHYTEDFAAVALALDHVLASNGGKSATITVARPRTEYPEAHRQPVYFGFTKGIAQTQVRIDRYPDDTNRADARGHELDLGLVRSARRLQAVADDPPVEVELGLESHGDGDFGIGLEIRDDPALPEDVRHA